MAKKEKESISWDAFEEDNLLDNQEEETQEEEAQEEEETEEEEEQEEKPKPKSKAKKKAEDKEDDEESEEEEEKPKKKAKAKSKEVEEESEETEETEEEEEGADATEEDSEEDESEDSIKFFEEVEKLTGQELDVDYGDTDPLTPEGVALREGAVRKAALESFLEEIETKYPKAYKALQFAYDGGDVADLFKTTASRDYSKVEIGDKDTGLAKEILKEYYQLRGVKSDARLAKLLAEAEDSEEGLVAEAKGVLAELKEDQSKAEAKVVEEQKQKADKQKKRDQILASAISDIVETDKLGTFKIGGPREQAEFRKFVIGNVRRTEDGGYEFASEIDDTNLEKLLQFQYFQFKKGDVSKLVQIKAATENAKRLKLRLANEKAKGKKGSSSDSGKSSDQLSFKDFETD